MNRVLDFLVNVFGFSDNFRMALNKDYEVEISDDSEATASKEFPVFETSKLLISKKKMFIKVKKEVGKSGSIDQARDVYKSVSNPNIITNTSMINAYGLNGMGMEAINLYREIPIDERNEVSQICVLNACSHSGLLDEAWNIYNEINIKTEKIITIMVDCLSRLFVFDEAQNLIDSYEKSHRPSVVMYITMLSGLRNHRNIDLSEKVYHRMKSIFPTEKDSLVSGAILLANIYSSLGEHQQGRNFRSNQLRELKQKVKIGLSWTEVNDELVQFKAHDRSHPRSSEIYAELDRFAAELIAHGYKFDSSWITRPIREYETIQSVLCGHSEKLAIAYNFIQRPIPSIIQVTKNLRICGDCHAATKLIAKIRQRDIIVRDAHRIHHFHSNGKCSCQDHF
ncbi:unnamed protein product [Rotaria magnacalcarata]|uniref:DYW domain-containing protein n=1 Tax=Rotaria magnacalcarata TaxID=392030 RepID=A0A816VH57_9BILA|nr:unnamed protein product [Rotaria magnacalcarata]CAF4168085.1 unnamed protein product [Rotaria magnacalcarata]